MKILKRWNENAEKLQAEGEPVNWFPTTESECLDHTEQAGYWKKGSVLSILADGDEVFTPFATYKAAQHKEITMSENMDYILEHLGNSVTEQDVHTEFGGKDDAEILEILDQWFPTDDNETLADAIHHNVN